MDKIDQKKLVLQQRINRLREQETKIKLQERKTRTRNLIALGGLIEKAGLSHLTSAQLYGALLYVKDHEGRHLVEWEKKGAAAFKKEDSEYGKSPITVKFDAEPPRELRQKLRDLGLRWNSLRQEWEGQANKEEAEKAMSSYQVGTIQDLAL